MKVLYKYNPAENEIMSVFKSESIVPQMSSILINNEDYYFVGKNIDTEIYKYKIENDAPELIADVNLSNAGGFSNNIPALFQTYNGRMYFNAFPGGGIASLWDKEIWSKGTDEGDYIKLVDELTSTDHPVFYGGMVEINNRVYFSGSFKDGEFRQLVSYKAGEDSIRWHGNVTSPPAGPSVFLNGLIAFNDQLVFSAFRDHFNHTQFFNFDTNTEQLELLPGLEGFVGHPKFIVDDYLIFTGADTNNIWDQNILSFNLASGEIMEIVNDSMIVGNGRRTYRLGDKVWCPIRDPNTNNVDIQLFDPATGDKSIITPNGLTSIEPSFTTSYQGKTWFHFSHTDSSRIYTIDPVTEICEEVINLGEGISVAGPMTWFDDKLFFYGGKNPSESGKEIYCYDPVEETIRLYADINIGPDNSVAHSFYIFDDRLYFVADDGHRGHELWSIGKCFSVSLDATSDPMGNSEGAVNLTIENGAEPFTFLWNNGATTQNISGLNSGYFEVSITDANGCQATAFVLLEGDIIASTSDDVFSAKVNVYPNPANGYLNIELSKLNEDVSAYIFNYAGIKIWDKKGLLQNAKINVSEFDNGIYFVVLIEGQNKITTRKIVVQH